MIFRRVATAAIVLALAAGTSAMAMTPLPDGVIAPDVSIDGVPVGGFTSIDARRAILDQRILPRQAPLVVSLDGKRMSIKPVAVGYFADLTLALDTALTYGRTVPIAGPVNVPLEQIVDRAQIRTVLRYRAKEIETVAVDAMLSFKNQRPVVRKPRLGTKLDVAASVPLVADAILTRAVAEVVLPFTRVRPARTTVGPSVVVNRGNRTLTLFRETKLVRRFRIAVGTRQYPTPRGRFRIIEKQRNPTWFPPDSPWAKGLGPVPPGSGNPLGTRWMGTSAPAIGIHGTPASSSIGTAASHGCIRMYIREAEWLYERVKVGTPVLIV